MKQNELNEIIRRHEMWLENKAGGKTADIRWENLREANFDGVNFQGAKLRGDNLQKVNFRGANLRGVDFYHSDLRGADLRGANVDFSCLPLWYGSLDVVIDKRIAAQLAYHFCRTICDDPEVKEYQKMLAPLANQFHRVNECGKIKEE